MEKRISFLYFLLKHRKQTQISQEKEEEKETKKKTNKEEEEEKEEEGEGKKERRKRNSTWNLWNSLLTYTRVSTFFVPLSVL